MDIYLLMDCNEGSLIADESGNLIYFTSKDSAYTFIHTSVFKKWGCDEKGVMVLEALDCDYPVYGKIDISDWLRKKHREAHGETNEFLDTLVDMGYKYEC